jgi:DNA mismatch endonuclease (patch repair protein)
MSQFDTPTPPGRSRNMQAIRRTDTKPEVRIRSALHRAGYRFRKDLKLDTSSMRVRPDIVFTRHKVAVFIDGCFWHCCPEHGRHPKVNKGYWSPKLESNVDRDKRATAALETDGWLVIRIWDHVPTTEAAQVIATAMRARQTS